MKRWGIAGVVLTVGMMLGAMSWAYPAFASASTSEACPVLTGGSSGGEGVAGGYTADLLGQANEGCNVLITENSNGSFTTTNPNTNGFYDTGGDDNLVGVVNNTSHSISSLTLSNPSSDIFGFDGDGPCGGYTFAAGTPDNGYSCTISSATQNYAPNGVTYSGINSSSTSGTVNFTTAIPAGGSAWFGLEGPASLNTVVSATPEPGTVALCATGMLGMVGSFLRRRRS
jgi:hypothetical protein